MTEPKNRRELGQALDACFDRYRYWLEEGCRVRGWRVPEQIAGLEQMENEVGVVKARERYAECREEMERISAAFMSRMDAPFLAADREREAVENRVMALKRADQAVQFAENLLARERARAAACVKFGVCSQDEADDIVEDAEDALEDAREELASVSSAEQMSSDDRAKRILAMLPSYTGPVKLNGKPRLRPFRRHVGLADLTIEERNRFWKIIQQEP